jgi:hypothetical protein
VILYGLAVQPRFVFDPLQSAFAVVISHSYLCEAGLLGGGVGSIVPAPQGNFGSEMAIGQRAAIGLLFLVSAAAVAFGQSGASQPAKPPDSLTGTPEQRKACGPDVGRLCKSVDPKEGAPAYLACLVANRENLSEACRNALDSAGQ